MLMSVRADRREVSTAMSHAELPPPMTSTRFPAKGSARLVGVAVEQLAGEGAGVARHPRVPVVPGRDQQRVELLAPTVSERHRPAAAGALPRAPHLGSELQHPVHPEVPRRSSGSTP